MKRIKRKIMPLAIYAVIFLMLIAAAGCAQKNTAPAAKPAKDKIVIGQAISLSGPLAASAAAAGGPAWEMWVKEVNAQGGIYVKEYGKKLPVEYIKYDDKSDLGTMTKLLEKLILEDKVDFVLPPWSTAFLYAAAPIANKHGYILIGGPGGALQLKEIMPNLPYAFQVLNCADTQVPVLVEILKETGLKTAAIVHHEDLHGIEYKTTAIPEMQKAGIEVKMTKSFPLGTKDLSPLLKEAKTLGVDAFIGFVYPDEGMLLISEAMELGYNFKNFFLSVGPSFPFFVDAFGPEVVEGVMGGGAWNAKSSPGAKEFFDLYKKYFGKEPNYWGELYFYASLQHFQQAIEEAGTLDQGKIRELLATKTYNTYVGPFKYDQDRFFRGYLGQIGQWQKGIFEVVDPGKNRTAPPILKPDWPKKG
ncbi:MAG: amino acid ABC transporter substrate-binding protein [Peptococcaceae bacterium]|nr:amino acid ABC transporter substrate-binding protein [Peptococcaceae bacterium]